MIMVRKFIIVILSVVLIVILTKSFFKLFEWDVEVDYQEKIWVKVLLVETIVRKVSGRGMAVTHITNWNATVDMGNDNTTIVNVAHGPVPQAGECMPIIANYLTNGKVWAILNVEQWRFATTRGPC